MHGRSDVTISKGSARRTIDDVFVGKDNNFNLLRVIAATFVLFHHCYPLTGVNNWDPFTYYLGDYDTGGGFGVAIFFVISGFLVTKSVLQHDLLAYLSSRALRIVPGLAVALLFTAFIVGPLFTRTTFHDYMRAAQTWRYLGGVNVFAIKQDLPGLFLANPEAGVANGSLWTLPIECGFYLLLPVLGALGLLKRWTALGVLVVAGASYAVLVNVFHYGWNDQGGYLYLGAPLYSTVRNFIFFFVGSNLWLWRGRVVYSGGLATSMLLLLYVFSISDYKLFVFYLGLPYIVIYIAFMKNDMLNYYERFGDYSYGIYIYAYPVQQAIVAKTAGAISPLHLFAFSAPITLVLAMASWRFVEHPALRLRHRLFRRDDSPSAARPLSATP
jgi:peptidoglycan/LPS O-acetylase OafA/YrhL